jgi:hypothetical protein
MTTESPASETRPASLADRNDDARSSTAYLTPEGAANDVEKALNSDSSVTPEPQSQDSTPKVEYTDPDASDVVDWDSADDPHNPMNWSTARKWGIIALVSAITFVT